jgi:mannose-6-phosphate isomerase-like protein (cupin superfamily)
MFTLTRRGVIFPAASHRPAPLQRMQVMPQDAQPRKPAYTVKNVETVVAGTDVLARVYTLAPGEVIPWHAHSNVTDHFFVLDGALTVETRGGDGDGDRALAVGERCAVTPGNAHQTSNRGATDCRFLLIQGVGKYDWIKQT